MVDIPRTRAPDTTLALLRDGYEYISKRCRHYHSDAFETRLLGSTTTCVTGRDAARLLYDDSLFQRSETVPSRIVKTLFGRGGVQGLDDHEHEHRKRMFMSMMTHQRIGDFAAGLDAELRSALPRWAAVGRIVLLREMRFLLCRAACTWSGIVASDEEIRNRASDFADMVDGFAAIGPRWRRARRARRRAETWARQLVDRSRAGQIQPPVSTALHIIANHRGLDEQRLDVKAAGVELLNVLQPIVAIANYVAFQGLALRDHPAYRERLKSNDALLEAFGHEVRRFYPFTPFVGASARRSFDWRGMHIPAGRRVLLDVYGTNRDPRLWEDPDTFRPERFLDRPTDAFRLIPQGGGDTLGGHHCAGEAITVAATMLSAQLLTRSIVFQVPIQDAGYDLARIPTHPRSGFIMQGIRPTASSASGRERKRALHPSLPAW